MVELLLNTDTNVFSPLTINAVLLHATAQAHEAVVKLLLDSRMTAVNSATFKHAPPHGVEGVVRLLQKMKVRVDRYVDKVHSKSIFTKAVSGTALLEAISRGYTNIVWVLLKSEKCDIYFEDNDGNTPLPMASKCRLRAPDGRFVSKKLLLNPN